jgi:hypothetical protein
MMSVLERVSPEVRRKTGWILPAGIAAAIGTFGPQTETQISLSEQRWIGALILGGIAVGVLWQWFSPRNLADRLALPAGTMILAGIFFLLPIGDEPTFQMPYPLWFAGGLLAGLVLTTGWQQLRAED